MMTTTQQTQAYVLLSGGIDSSTALALAVSRHGNVNTTAFSINYGQVHNKELLAAKEVSDHFEVQMILLQLSPQPASPLTNHGINAQIPDLGYDELPKGVSPSYHPFRNGQLLSLATAHAFSIIYEVNTEELESGLEAPDLTSGLIYFGAHAEDAANWAYADCTPEFVGAMANAIFIGTYQKVRLITPFLHMRKSEIIRLGEQLEVPYELTWSCYHGGEKHCRVCPTCQAREDAFSEAEVEDPTDYALTPSA